MPEVSASDERSRQSQAPVSRSVQRALEIFELILGRGEPVTVADVVTDVGIPKSSAYELIRTLAQAGYIERTPVTGTYALGRKLYELGMAYRSQVDLLKEGGRVVEALRDETGETVQLSVLENGMMLALVKEESHQPIRIISRVGSRVPVNWAAAGRLLVSDLDDDALRSTLAAHSVPSPTRKAPTDIDRLMTQVREFRAQGYGVELGEANEHAGCVAAPVVNAAGKCIAAISVVAPEIRLQEDRRERLIVAVIDAAATLSSRLGAL